MAETLIEAIENLRKAKNDFINQVLKEFTALKYFPSPFDKKCSPRILICIAYVSFVRGLIEGTAYILNIIMARH